jgi:DNA-binding NarL/FixJ family response regulator
VTEPSRKAAVFIIDPNPIFCLGMAACLESLEAVGLARGFDTVREAREALALADADLVIVDAAAPQMHAFVRDLRARHGTPSLVSGSSWQAEDIAAVVESGAVGILAKETLTPATLELHVRAALHGAAVLPSEVVPDLIGMANDDLDAEAPIPVGQLNAREQQVLRLIAEGHATREVAEQLCYSERTIKNVLHDVAMKLGARSRSHAVAHAVREGLI